MGSYYDPDSILTSAEKLPCQFRLDVRDLGHIDDNPGEDIRAKTSVSLPLWLATILSVQRLPTGQSIIQLDLIPSITGNKARNAIRADPRVVDLRALSPYYYALAAQVFEMWDLEAEVELQDGGMTVEQGLVNAFKIRVAEIADHAQNPRGLGSHLTERDLVGRLDDFELKLYKATRESSRSVREWLGERKKQ